MRGYFGIGIEAGKTPENIGGLWRSAHALGASFIFTVGHRYDRQPTDTTKAHRHVPLWEWLAPETFLAAVPHGCKVVGVDCANGTPTALPEFRHPERAIYVLGAEDRGLSAAMLDRCDALVEIPSRYCLNVATAGAVVLYDRMAKGGS